MKVQTFLALVIAVSPLVSSAAEKTPTKTASSIGLYCEGLEQQANGVFYRSYEVFGVEYSGGDKPIDVLESTTGELVKKIDPTGSDNNAFWASPVKSLHKDAEITYKSIQNVGNEVQSIVINEADEVTQIALDLRKPCLTGEGKHWTYPAQIVRTDKSKGRGNVQGKMVCRDAYSVDLYNEKQFCKGEILAFQAQLKNRGVKARK